MVDELPNKINLFNRLLLNALFLYGAKVFEGILQLAVLGFILSQAGREYYAAALLIISIQATVELARGGIQKATLKYIAEYRVKHDFNAVNSLLSSSSAIQGGVGLLGLGICLILSPFINILFSLPGYMQNESTWATILLGFGIAVSFALSPWRNCVAAQERYDLLSIAGMCGKATRAVLIIIMLLLNLPILISIVFATVCGKVAEQLICIVFIKRISPAIIFKINTIQTRYITIMLRFSMLDFFHTLSALLYFQGSLYLTTHLISLNAVAALGIIFNITSLLGLLTQQVAQMLVPVTSRLNAEGNIAKLKNLVSRGTTITVFAGGIVTSGIIPWIQSIFFVWLGTAYTELAVPAILLIVATFLVNSVTCIHNSLSGIGRLGMDAISNTVCTVLGLVISSVMVLSSNIGLYGIVIGLLSARILRFIFLNWYSITLFQLSFPTFIVSAYFRTFLLTASICLIGLLANLSFTSWPALIAAGSISSGLYILLGLFFVIEPADRALFKRAVADGALFLKHMMKQKAA